MRTGILNNRSMSEIVEAALERCPSREANSGEAPAASRPTARPPAPEDEAARSSGDADPAFAPVHAAVVVGEVLDTHHPHLPGRVLVRRLDEQGRLVDRWLQRERHLSLIKGDRVLLTLPAGWNEWIVTGALARAHSSRDAHADEVNSTRLDLGPGEAVRVVSHDGRHLLTIRDGADGPVLEIGDGNLELAATRTLRLRAEAIEIASAEGGVDIRSDGDTIVRARTIRLN